MSTKAYANFDEGVNYYYFQAVVAGEDEWLSVGTINGDTPHEAADRVMEDICQRPHFDGTFNGKRIEKVSVRLFPLTGCLEIEASLYKTVSE